MNLIQKYSRAVPRYTSYPTAPHFTETSFAYNEWLSAINSSSGLSLYVHVPFCEKLCYFCGCHTKIVGRYNPVSDYMEPLLQEIALVGKQLTKRHKATHIHFGGGSPSILSDEDFASIIHAFGKIFDIGAHTQIDIELDPRTVRLESLAPLAKLGVQRASFGVQDFDAKVQKAINRIQSFELTQSVIEKCREVGISKINCDLIYGLPHQTLASFQRTVEATLELNPDRISLFGYAHVPWMKKHMKMIPEEHLPNAEERVALYQEAASILADCGYTQIGLDHFAKAADEMTLALHARSLQRNFQGYTADSAKTMIGFGASAIGFFEEGYAQNISDIKDYQAAIQAGNLPTARGIAVTNDDRLRRAIIEQLMCYLEVDLAALTAAYGLPLETVAESVQLLRPLEADGLCHLAGSLVTIPESARLYMRLVASCFDTYLNPSERRHSQSL